MFRVCQFGRALKRLRCFHASAGIGERLRQVLPQGEFGISVQIPEAQRTLIKSRSPVKRQCRRGAIRRGLKQFAGPLKISGLLVVDGQGFDIRPSSLCQSDGECLVPFASRLGRKTRHYGLANAIMIGFHLVGFTGSGAADQICVSKDRQWRRIPPRQICRPVGIDLRQWQAMDGNDLQQPLGIGSETGAAGLRMPLPGSHLFTESICREPAYSASTLRK